jgi:hypothetical protein
VVFGWRALRPPLSCFTGSKLSHSPLPPVQRLTTSIMKSLRFILFAAALPAAASFALGGKMDSPGKPKAAAGAADVESGAVCKRMTESDEETVASPFELGR